MCEVLPAEDRGKVFEKLNGIIEGLEIDTNDSRIPDGGVALKELIDSIFEVAKAKKVDWEKFIKSLMEDVKIEVEVEVASPETGLDNGYGIPVSGLKAEKQNLKFKDTIYFQKLFNNDLSNSDTKLFENSTISSDIEDEYYEKMFKFKDDAQLSDVSSDNITNVSKIEQDVNESSLISLGTPSANSSFEDSMDEQEFRILPELTLGDKGVFENEEKVIEGYNEENWEENFKRDLQKLKSKEKNFYLDGNTPFEKVLKIDKYYEKILNGEGLTEDEFLTWEKEDPSFLKELDLKYDQVVKGGKLDKIVKEKLRTHLKNLEQKRVENYYSNTLNGRIVVLNDLGYKDIVAESGDLLYKALEFGLGKVATKAVGTLAGGPITGFLVGTVADAAVDYIVEHLSNRFNKKHDTMHPELEKEIKSMKERLGENLIKNIDKKLIGKPVSAVLDKVGVYEFVGKISKEFGKAFNVDAKSIEDYVNKKIQKTGTDGLKKLMSSAYEKYQKK